MLRPIPGRILQSTITVKVCSGTDLYQNQTYDAYTINRVHLQPTKAIVKSKDNTDMQLSSILFVDRKLSTPFIDWAGLLESAHNKGGDMRVVCRGREYTVQYVDELMDDTDSLHHWEVGLV